MTDASLRDTVGSERPPAIYLDQNFWVQLLQGLKHQRPVATRLIATLVEKRRAGQLLVPLSSGHYLELWHRSSMRSRTDLATLMKDVSGYQTLSPLHLLERTALQGAVRRARGLDAGPEPNPFGFGVNHAFDSPTGRFRVVESVARNGSPEGQPAAVPASLLAAAQLGEAWEWANLVGFDDWPDPSDIDITPQHRLGSEHVVDETRLRAWLDADPSRRRSLEVTIAFQEIRVRLDAINDACQESGLDPRTLLSGGQASTFRLIAEMPPVDVMYQLRLARQRDRTFPFEQHDVTDLCVLAQALPICDVVATERRWCHVARHAGLDKRYDTTVLSSLDDLLSFVD